MNTLLDSDSTDETALFPIGTISEQTGVNTVTLRAWERRYGLLKPHRTPKGHRLYSTQDVQRVKQVLVLLEQGIPVSRVRDVLDSNQKMNPVLLSPTTTAQSDDPWRFYWQQFHRYVRKLDTRALEHTFNEVVALYSLELAAKKLLLPFYQHCQQQCLHLPSTQVDWTFFHEFLCAKLSSRYLQHNSRATGKRIAIHHTPDHTVDALLITNSLSQHGYQVSFLGANLTLDQLTLMLERTDLDALLLIGSRYDTPTLQTLVAFSQLPTFITAPWEDTEGNDQPPLLYNLHEDNAEMLQQLDDLLSNNME